MEMASDTWAVVTHAVGVQYIINFGDDHEYINPNAMMPAWNEEQ